MELSEKKILRKGKLGPGPGRPKGMPNKVTRELGGLARMYTEEALNGLVALMRSEKVSALARIAAMKEILDRGYGKAPQAIDLQSNGKGLFESITWNFANNRDERPATQSESVN